MSNDTITESNIIFAESVWSIEILNYSDEQTAQVLGGLLIAMLCSTAAAVRTGLYYKHKLASRLHVYIFLYQLSNILSALSVFCMGITAASMACMWAPHAFVELALISCLLHPIANLYFIFSIVYILLGTLVVFPPNGLNFYDVFTTFGAAGDLLLLLVVVFTWWKLRNSAFDSLEQSEAQLTPLQSSSKSISDVRYAWNMLTFGLLLHATLAIVGVIQVVLVGNSNINYLAIYVYFLQGGVLNMILSIFIEYNTYIPAIQSSKKTLYVLYVAYLILVTIVLAAHV